MKLRCCGTFGIITVEDDRGPVTGKSVRVTREELDDWFPADRPEVVQVKKDWEAWRLAEIKRLEAKIKELHAQGQAFFEPEETQPADQAKALGPFVIRKERDPLWVVCFWTGMAGTDVHPIRGGLPYDQAVYLADVLNHYIKTYPVPLYPARDKEWFLAVTQPDGSIHLAARCSLNARLSLGRFENMASAESAARVLNNVLGGLRGSA